MAKAVEPWVLEELANAFETDPARIRAAALTKQPDVGKVRVVAALPEPPPQDGWCPLASMEISDELRVGERPEDRSDGCVNIGVSRGNWYVYSSKDCDEVVLAVHDSVASDVASFEIPSRLVGSYYATGYVLLVDRSQLEDVEAAAHYLDELREGAQMRWGTAHWIDGDYEVLVSATSDDAVVSVMVAPVGTHETRGKGLPERRKPWWKFW